MDTGVDNNLFGFKLRGMIDLDVKEYKTYLTMRTFSHETRCVKVICSSFKFLQGK